MKMDKTGGIEEGSQHTHLFCTQRRKDAAPSGFIRGPNWLGVWGERVGHPPV